MDIINELNKRIRRRMIETKNPCKSYKTYEGASKAAAKVGELIQAHHETNRPPRYVVFNVKNLGWVAAFDLTELMNRPECQGGYLGLACDKGFYTY